jgi:hypothetical protein
LDLVGEPPPPTDFSKQIEAGSGRGWEYILVGGGWKLAFMTFPYVGNVIIPTD